MKRIIALTICLVLGIGCFAGIGEADTPRSSRAATKSATKSATSKDTKDYLEGQAIVTLAVPEGAESDLLQTGTLRGDRSIRIKHVLCFDDAAPLGKTKRARKSLRGKNLYFASVISGAYTTKQLKAFLKKYSYVESVVPNYKIHRCSKPNDPYFDEQWALGGEGFMPGYCYAATAASGSSVSSSAADFLPDKAVIKDSATVPASSIGFMPEEKMDLGDKTPIVAVVDDGVDYTKEDLKNMMWVNPYDKEKLPGKYGYDCFMDDDDPIPYEGDSHATLIGGIIAAESDNNYGIAGICKNAKLMSLKVYNGEDGSYEADLVAYEYIYKAMKLGANVVSVNNSYGSDPTEEEEPEMTEILTPFDVVINKVGALGAVTVFAAGNHGIDTDKYKWGLPEQVDSTYMLRVGALTFEGKPAGFSNYGTTSVDLFAPGTEILSYRDNDECFVPQAYDAETRSKLCLYYTDFSDYSTDRVKTIEDIRPDKKTAISLSHSDWDFKGNKKSGSLKIEFRRTRTVNDYSYVVYFDVTGKNLVPSKEYYINSAYTTESAGSGDWTNYPMTLSKDRCMTIYSYGGHTYLAYDLRRDISPISNQIGKTVFLDDVAISMGDPDTTQFGGLEYVSGTSFSAPIVAAAVARLAVMYPDDNALTRKQKILASVRELETLKGKCATGGTLDMSKFASVSDIRVDAINYKVESIDLNKTSATVKLGKTLKLKASVSPEYATKKGVTWKVSKSAYASVSSKGVVTPKKKGVGHTVKVTATAKDGSGAKAVCKVKIVS